jgi:tetratricopeptide (TPR) repeat protein
MHELAQRLINLRERQSTNRVATAIFGTAGTLSRNLDTRERVRIGMWPCVSADAPETAMGLFALLAALLERWQDIRVYRLFARLDGEPADYTWTIDQSQFSVDDWQIEPLDENVAVWGSLARTAVGWALTVEFENDLDDEDTITLTYDAETVAALVNTLPQVTRDIAEALESTRVLLDAYEPTNDADERIQPLLDQLARWNINLLLSLWGVAWPSIHDDLDRLLDTATAVGGDFGAWAAGSTIGHALLPGYAEVGEMVSEQADAIIERFPQTSYPAMAISGGLYNRGEAQRAQDMMEDCIANHPQSTRAYTLLALLYRRSGQYQEVLETYQAAIEAEAVDATLYQRYAEFLTLLQGYNGDFVLIEAEDYPEDDRTTWEAVEALEEALALDPDRAELLRLQLVLLVGVMEEPAEEERLWAGFERLVGSDETGDSVRAVVDAFYNLEAFDPGITILENAIEASPERPDLHVNLAVAYLLADEGDLAAEQLEAAEDLTDDDNILADIDRLMLQADDPEFEAHLGEIIALVDANSNLGRSDMEFLESAIEDAPSLAEAYVLLARAYLIKDQSDKALEVLLDGHNENEDDPDIVHLMAQLLWENEEYELAFKYLNIGVTANPNHVPLLVLTGQYLFEDDQLETARAYFGRAEAIAPRHPALVQARASIAELMNEEE